MSDQNRESFELWRVSIYLSEACSPQRSRWEFVEFNAHLKIGEILQLRRVRSYSSIPKMLRGRMPIISTRLFRAYRLHCAHSLAAVRRRVAAIERSDPVIR